MKTKLFIGYREGEELVLEWTSPAVLDETIELDFMPNVIACLRSIADDMEKAYVKGPTDGLFGPVLVQ